MERQLAHDIKGVERSRDIRLREEIPYRKMRLGPNVKKGLQNAGFEVPTRIQALAIPTANMGVDILVQSNSGTGKTIIFATILLEKYTPKVRAPQALVLVPTREIAIQVADVINSVGKYCEGFSCVYIIGGTNVSEDRKKLENAKAVVGTPGRLNHLIQNNALNLNEIDLLVLDEADQLYAKSMKSDIIRIQKKLNCRLKEQQRQCHRTIACSATMTDELASELATIMDNPIRISTDSKPTLLLAIKQFVYELPEPSNSMHEMMCKLDAVKYFFGCIPFKQCLIFADSQSRADSYCTWLQRDGWPASLISAAQCQRERTEVFEQLRKGQTRIVVSTDLFARGIDCENVNLIINLELPPAVFTYLHRIGRAGRFGTPGIAISVIAGERQRQHFSNLMAEVGNGMAVLNFPKDRAFDAAYDFWNFKQHELEIQLFGLFGEIEAIATNEEGEAEVNSTSSIDTKTFRIDLADSALNVLDMRMMDGSEACVQHKVTPESQHTSSQQLPSSNTIDDASSIAPDSVRSSVPSIMELLVDHREPEHVRPSKVDLYDDYRRCIETAAEPEGTKPLPEDMAELASDLSSLLIDKHPTPAGDLGDVYSDYFNFEPAQGSSSRHHEHEHEEEHQQEQEQEQAQESKHYPSLAHGVQTVTPIGAEPLSECQSSLLAEPRASLSDFAPDTSSTLSDHKRSGALSICRLEQISIPAEPVICSLCSALVAKGLDYHDADRRLSCMLASSSTRSDSVCESSVSATDSAGRLILFQRSPDAENPYSSTQRASRRCHATHAEHTESVEESEMVPHLSEEAEYDGSAQAAHSMMSNPNGYWFQLFNRQLSYMRNYTEMIRTMQQQD